MVNSVSFGKRDNENNPTGGKWIGAGLGTALGGYRMYKVNKMYNELDEFLATDAGKKLSNCKDSESLKKSFSESSLSATTKKECNRLIKNAQFFGTDKKPNFVNNFIASLNVPKKIRTVGLTIGLGLLALIGLGLGAIVDHFRKHDEED